jgi:putative NADH-flavin reductase
MCGFNLNKELHVVLGSSGATGQAVVEELKSRNLNIREVERKKIPGVETVNADLLDLTRL